MHNLENMILTNMCMIYENLGNVLVRDRIKNWCGIAFPGGHVEHMESVVDSVIREIKEETGLAIEELEICGVKQWFNNDVRNVVFLYKTSKFSGELISNDEGINKWILLKDIFNYKLASNFEIMLEVFLNDKYTEFYHNGFLNINALK